MYRGNGSQGQAKELWDWLLGTVWTEGLATYEVLAPPLGRTCDFWVTRHIDDRTYSVPLFVREHPEGEIKVLYGNDKKWFAKTASEHCIIWAATSSERTDFVWSRKLPSEGSGACAEPVKPGLVSEVGAETDEVAEVIAKESMRDGARQEEKWSKWKRYLDTESGRYWWCDDNGDCWFFENDPSWKRYKDPANDRVYWWHVDTGSLFWADTGSQFRIVSV